MFITKTLSIYFVFDRRLWLTGAARDQYVPRSPVDGALAPGRETQMSQCTPARKRLLDKPGYPSNKGPPGCARVPQQ
eukprot:619786-Prorocentrum_minimum.AAC.1